jgi:hypothetical protein
MPFGFRASSKDDEAAGVSVESVNGPEEEATGGGREGARGGR